MMGQQTLPKRSFRAAARWDQDQLDGANFGQLFNLDGRTDIRRDGFGFGKGAARGLELELLALFQLAKQLAGLEKLEVTRWPTPVEGLAEVFTEPSPRGTLGGEAAQRFQQFGR